MTDLDKSNVRFQKKALSDGHIEKQILLLKLTNELENIPAFGDGAGFDVGTPIRNWVSVTGALLSRISIEKKIDFKTAKMTLASYPLPTIKQIIGQVADAIEDIKLELELEGRADIGNAYPSGDVYNFFSDLKEIINSAEKQILVIDPYFDGKSFDAYLSSVARKVEVKILASRYTDDIKTYVDKYIAQYGGTVELRHSLELHDRIVFIDRSQAWIMGGSIKDAANKKPTYLIPLASQIMGAKYNIYSQIWDRSDET